MQQTNEVYRAVNRYVDFSTNTEFLDYTKTYSTAGKAKAQATRNRLPKKKTKYNNMTRQYEDIKEFVETWCERATEWTKV